MKLQCIQQLAWPRDRWKIALLGVADFQVWYASQNAKSIVFLAQTHAFRRFLYWKYLLPVKILRFCLKCKSVFRESLNFNVNIS